MDNLGYSKFLFILPFDHRSTFTKGMFGLSQDQITPEIVKAIKIKKKIIYEGFKKAVSKKVPKEFSAILIDEEFGDEILKDARSNGFVTILTTEKSGQKEFSLEYGENFKEHIDKYSPVFAKVLVRFNPQENIESKERQKKEIKKLSDFCHEKGYKFLAEILIDPTIEQLEKVGQDKIMFDKVDRPKLGPRVIDEFQDFGIEPDVWKMEGLENKEDYEILVKTARRKGRENVGVVVLGRGAEKNQVDKWIIEGARVNGVIGFAVGRTVFWDPLMKEKKGELSQDDAIEMICNNFIYYYDLFMAGRKTL